jgi:protoheme IX farnesyltransferase
MSFTTPTPYPVVLSASPSDYWALMKPRVMSLVVFTAICGLVMAPGSVHPVLAITAILCIAVGAGAAGTLNMWWERDLDQRMERTRQRPLPQERMAPESALAFGIICACGSVLVMGCALNLMAALLLTFTIFFYVFVYTLWLKPLTPQNIVIGGVSGALPPVIGWVAVTGVPSLEAWTLFLIIFLWTPPHFWALSLYRVEDYRRAGIPMLPVVAGPKKTKQQIVIYTILLGLSTILPVFQGLCSLYYGAFAVLLSVFLLLASLRLYGTSDEREGMKFFGLSILYLFAIFAGMLIDYGVHHG